MKLELFDRLLTEPLYLKNDLHRCVMRTTPANKETGEWGGRFIRFSNKPEYQITSPENTIVFDTLNMGEEITEDEYYKF